MEILNVSTITAVAAAAIAILSYFRNNRRQTILEVKEQQAQISRLDQRMLGVEVKTSHIEATLTEMKQSDRDIHGKLDRMMEIVMELKTTKP